MEKLAVVAGQEEFRDCCNTELEKLQKQLDEILKPGAKRTVENTLAPLDLLTMSLGKVLNMVGFLRSVHPEAEIRSAAEESEKELAKFANDLGLNRDLYEAVNACDTAKLDPTGQRMLSHLIRDFRRAGVDRDEPTRERVRVLREELVSMGQDFTRNIVSDVRSISLDGEHELDGLPADYIKERKAGPDGKIRISTDYPDYKPFMTYAVSGERRRELYKEFRLRAYPQNIEVLAGILRVRHELATLLGYPSWATYVTEDKMIKTPTAVSNFIERVSEISLPRAKREYAELLALKKEEEPEATEVHDWEKSYYEEVLRSRSFAVDSRQVRSYFDYSRVKEGVLALSEDLFGVRFSSDPDALRWHPDVEVLEVMEGGKNVGRVYLDMHPREGKFKHAAMFPLVRGLKGKAVPQAALVCNFPNPRTSCGPALLEHDDVVTFFHEFGHLLHQLLARDHEWSRFSGAATEWDFIEVPSQLYEEWAWDYQVLQRFAVHSETGETISEALVERMRRAQDFGRGLWVRHQMFYAAVSLKCYGVDASHLDTDQVVKEMQETYSLFPFVEDTYFQASFGHLDDYSALYYTYMWSLVMEKDIYEEFKARGAMSREAAATYREHILAPGGSLDASELVRNFLGRDYSFEAFEKWLDGTGSQEKKSADG